MVPTLAYIRDRRHVLELFLAALKEAPPDLSEGATQASLRCHLCTFRQAGQSIGIGRSSEMDSKIIVSVRSPVWTAVPNVGQRIIISGINSRGAAIISPVKSKARW
jgi:hypothetical protein